MSATSTNETNYLATFSRLIDPDEMPADVARYILRLRFSQRDSDRMNALAAKGQQGTLTPQEQAEIDGYCQAGNLLGLL